MKLNRIQKMGIAGAGMFFFGILLQVAILPPIVNSQLKRKVALKKGWMMREIWGKFPFSWEFQFYMFNVTNPDKIATGQKPIVEQIGPFIYDEWHEKTNQIDHEEDDTISYNTKNTLYFNTEKSQGLTGEEEIIVPNYFTLGLVNTVLREKPTAMPIVGKAIDSILKKPDSIFIKAKVKDILFDGLYIECKAKDFAGSAICNELKMQYETFGMKLIEEGEYLLSLWGSRNGSDSKARTRVYRGLKNIMDVGKVIENNNKPNISVWEDDYCDKFNGSDGTVFHPKFDKKGKDDLVAFNQGLCRSISCYYDSNSKFAGMNLLRYTTDLGTDASTNPHHKCYCENPDKCLRPGVYDVYKCIGLPLVVSNPHFYLADPYYLNAVEGLSPNKEKHMVIIDLDPFTGSPMYVHTRAQFNMFIMPLEKFKLMKTFPDALLPLFWIDEIIILPDFLIKEIKNGHRLLTLGTVFKHFMMFGGMALSGVAGFMHYKSTHGENKLDTKKNVQPTSANGSAEKKIQMNISTLQAAPVPPNVG